MTGSMTIVSEAGSFVGNAEQLAAHLMALRPSHLQEPQGSAILREKLRRAEAVPPGQRKAEEVAFVESVHLTRAIVQDLPLTDAGRPALRASPASRRLMLLATLAAARAWYTCPSTPISDNQWVMHLAAYESLFTERELTCSSSGSGGPSSGGSPSSGGGSSGGAAPADDGWPLCGLIRLLTQADDSVAYVHLAWQTATWLDDPALCPALERQLAQLAAAAQGQGGGAAAARLADAGLPTVPQLRFVAWLLTYEMGEGLLGGKATQDAGKGTIRGTPVHLSPAQEAAARLAEERAAAMMLQLEPDNPRSQQAAGFMLDSSHGSDASKIARHYKRCIQLAVAQRSRYWRMRGACGLLPVCAMRLGARSPATRALMEWAVREFERAQSKIEGSKARLPQRWTLDLENSLTGMAYLLEEAHAQLRGDAGTGPATASRRCLENLASGGQVPLLCRCDGCGTTAVGLQKCAGCKQASYCSAECQRHAWRSHKQACKAARAAAAAGDAES